MMKQTLSLLLIWALLCSCFLLPAGAEETDSPTLGALVAQLKAEETVEELWVPVLPEGYTLKNLTMLSPGNYLYRIFHKQESSLRIFGITVISSNNQDAGCSPYQSLLYQKNADAPMAVTAENLKAINKGDRVICANQMGTVTYTHTGVQGMGACQDCPALHLGWSYENTDPNSLVGSVNELVIGLSDTALISIMYDYRTDPSESIHHVDDLVAYFSESFDLSFTTPGDADTDGQVDAADALAILKHSVGKGEITDELAFLMADGDDSGTLDAADALSALRIAVGK